MGTPPLSGLNVLDVSTVLAGPMISALLGEWGASVTKIESPAGGDPTRHYPPTKHDEAVAWEQYGRGKRSIALDLHLEEAREVLHALVRTSDVVVTNFRPSTAERFGLGFETLREVNDRVVVVHLTAFGLTGPYRERPGFARVVEAFAGLTHRTGNPDGPPMFSGYPIADGVGGIYGAFAAMLALRQRDATGEAQLVDLGLYEPMLRMMEDFIPAYSLTGTSARRQGNENPAIVPNGLFATADNQWVVLPASTDAMWNRLLIVMDRPDLAHLDTPTKRLQARAEVEAAVSDFVGQYSQQEVLDRLRSHGLATGPVNTAQDIVDDPHIRDRGSVVVAHDRNGEEVLLLAPAGRFSGFDPAPSGPAPTLGEHTDEVMVELGLTSEESERLSAAGAFGPVRHHTAPVRTRAEGRA